MSRWQRACINALLVASQGLPGDRLPGGGRRRNCKHGYAIRKCGPCRRESVAEAGRRFRARQKEGRQ